MEKCPHSLYSPVDSSPLLRGRLNNVGSYVKLEMISPPQSKDISHSPQMHPTPNLGFFTVCIFRWMVRWFRHLEDFTSTKCQKQRDKCSSRFHTEKMTLVLTTTKKICTQKINFHLIKSKQFEIYSSVNSIRRTLQKFISSSHPSLCPRCEWPSEESAVVFGGYVSEQRRNRRVLIAKGVSKSEIKFAGGYIVWRIYLRRDSGIVVTNETI